MSYHTLVYLSHTKPELSIKELQNIAHSSTQNNTLNAITGILLYDNTVFLQILEGKKKNVLSLITKIQQDPRHHQLNILYNAPLIQRNFPQWSMEVKIIPNQLYGMTQQWLNSTAQKTTVLPTLTKLLIHVFSKKTTLELNSPTNVKLTSREHIILHATVQNYSSQQIATQLNISPKTVNRHIENIKQKMTCNSKNELIQKIFQSGLIHTFLLNPF